MADDQDDTSKTEEPTAKRLQDARNRGQVAVSRELNNWLVLLAATLALVGFSPSVVHDSHRLLTHFLANAHQIPFEYASMQSQMTTLALAVAASIGPLILAILAAGVAAGVGQVGWLMAPEAIKPQFSKISPLKGFGRLFSSSSLIEFVKGLAKMLIVGWACWLVAAPEFDRLPLFVLREPAAALSTIGAISLKLLIAAVAAMTVIAGADVFYQRIRLRRELRMSRTEVRDEFKEQEGDPMVKAKLRQIRQERSRRRMMQAVPKADVVITNPTHYAVALKYDRATMDAPILVAKGLDGVALKIRQVAEANRVPIVENPPLARALHASVELDEPISPEHYKAVAEVIGYVLRVRGHAARADQPNT